MARLGVSSTMVSPAVDEESFKRLDLPPRELAERLACEKALSVANKEPDAAIIGGDQVVSLDGRIFDKPGDAEAAADQLQALAGRTHELITAMAVWHAGRLIPRTDVARLRMRPLTRAEIERYVAADRPLDCAGSYKIEERGIALFERIETADWSSITGLPLIALASILRELGIPIP